MKSTPSLYFTFFGSFLCVYTYYYMIICIDTIICNCVYTQYQQCYLFRLLYSDDPLISNDAAASASFHKLQRVFLDIQSVAVSVQYCSCITLETGT